MSLLVALACSGERPKFGQRRAAALGADGGTAGETPSSTSFSGDGVTGASAGSTSGITGSVQPGNSPAGNSSTAPGGLGGSGGGPSSGGNGTDGAPTSLGDAMNAASCGDGVLDEGEACDDGPLNSATAPDACRATCTAARCGDGVIDTEEACDEGVLNSDTAANGCRTDCREASCGDGVLDATEGCDRGAANGSGDANGCSATCQLPGCGDGVVGSGEACDDGDDNDDSAPDTCRTTCQRSSCGDGVVDSTEACDDGASNSGSQADACRPDCSEPRCGDGVTDSEEECDGQADCNADCQRIVCGDGRKEGEEACDLGPDNSDTGACTSQCREAGCGDGAKLASEACDDGVLSGAYGECAPGCVFAPRCGDGTVDQDHEACDDGVNGGGYGKCKSDCQWDARCGDGMVQSEHGEQCESGSNCKECRTLAAARVTSFTSADSVLPAGGGSTTLSWVVRDAQSLSIEPGPGTVTGNNVTVNVTQTTTFTLTAQGSGGNASATVTVTLSAKGVQDELKLQFGGASGSQTQEYLADLAVTGNTLYVAYSGEVAGKSNDGFLRSLKDGQATWTRSFSTAETDSVTAVALASNGEVVVVGNSAGSLESGRGADEWGDGFVARVSANNELRWLKMIGAPGENEQVNDVATDANGNAYVCGQGPDVIDPESWYSDAFVQRFSAAGAPGWKASLHSDVADSATAVAVDAQGNVIVAGTTDGTLDDDLTSAGGRDLFVVKFDPNDSSGEPLWLRMLGSEDADFAHDIVVDGSGDIYLAGASGGTLGAQRFGDHDAIWAKFSGRDGTVLAKRQFGTEAVDNATALGLDAEGNLFIAGLTNAHLDRDFGSPSPPDAFIAKFSTRDTPDWVRQFGSTGTEEIAALAIDSAGRIVLGGHTTGTLFSGGNGSNDAFIVRYK